MFSKAVGPKHVIFFSNCKMCHWRRNIACAESSKKVHNWALFLLGLGMRETHRFVTGFACFVFTCLGVSARGFFSLMGSGSVVVLNKQLRALETYCGMKL